jgi:hypothetical protein
MSVKKMEKVDKDAFSFRAHEYYCKLVDKINEIIDEFGMDEEEVINESDED